MRKLLKVIAVIASTALLWAVVIVVVRNVNLQILGFCVATYLPLRIALREG